jgi:hypothetical protein
MSPPWFDEESSKNKPLFFAGSDSKKGWALHTFKPKPTRQKVGFYFLPITNRFTQPPGLRSA